MTVRPPISVPVPRIQRNSARISGSGLLGGTPPRRLLTGRGAWWDEETVRSRNDPIVSEARRDGCRQVATPRGTKRRSDPATIRSSRRHAAATVVDGSRRLVGRKDHQIPQRPVGRAAGCEVAAIRNSTRRNPVPFPENPSAQSRSRTASNASGQGSGRFCGVPGRRTRSKPGRQLGCSSRAFDSVPLRRWEMHVLGGGPSLCQPSQLRTAFPQGRSDYADVRTGLTVALYS